MISVKKLSHLSNIDYLPPKLYQIAENSVESDYGCTLLLESHDEITELRKYGLDSENLCPGYVEIVESGSEDYYCAMFFKNEGYTVLILPLSIAPSNFLDTYYINNEKKEDLGGEYARIEGKLVDTYTAEQMQIYIELEAAKEAAIADLQEQSYRKGFKDAVQTIYEERMIP